MMKKFFLLVVYIFILISPGVSFGQDAVLVQDEVDIVKARVVEIIEEGEREVVGTGIDSSFQKIRAEILEGKQKGREVTFENDYIILDEGDKFFLRHTVDGIYGTEMFSVKDVDRQGVILGFVVLFIFVVLIFSGMQGLRSLLSLAGSLFIILQILLPGLLKGYPPVLTSIVIAAVILFVAIYFTHGFNKVSTVAFLGTVISVIFTGGLAYVAVELTKLTGFSTDESVYLNFNTGGVLNFTGLLLGGIMIGVLGVLDDIAVTQAAVVHELYNSGAKLSGKDVYKKAIRVGREHVGALVNTLALAYTGVSLPLLLLFSTSDSSITSILNQEIFATEIIRTVVGSIGLILTVPITTILAAKMLKDYVGPAETIGHSRHSHAASSKLN